MCEHCCQSKIHESHSASHGTELNGLDHHEEVRSNPYVIPAVSLALLVAGLLMEFFNFHLFTENSVVELLWYLAAFLPLTLPVGREAIEAFGNRDIFNEFTLMLIASIGAFFIGEYPEAVGVMLFYTIGETLQEKAVAKARRDVASLLDKREKLVNVVHGDDVIKTAPEKVSTGETIMVRPGESVPLDGVLLSQTGTFDTSALTGESLPRQLNQGDTVLSGMMSLDSSVRIEVTAEYDKSTLSRIMDLVKDAASHKAKPELFIRKFARIYTPSVVLAAILIVLVPALVSLFDGGFEFVFSSWLRTALVFLVISCPCALVISVPLGYFMGIAAASRLGVLCKGGHVLENLAKMNVVALDKTGTLTTSVFKVSEIHHTDKISREEFLRLLAMAESESTHPLAMALVKEVAMLGLEVEKAGHIKETPGFGVLARSQEGMVMTAGSAKWLQHNEIRLPQEVSSVDSTAIFCAVDGAYIGYVAFSDTLKDDASLALDGLRNLGMKQLLMLSGDRRETVDHYASLLPLDEAVGGLLPADKAEFVKGLTETKGNCVGFVGDGINDAPVLALSDVGVAMGGLGSDVAIESADVVIQSDAPSRLVDAIRIARKTKAVIIENIVGAIGIKLAVMAFGVIGIATLWAAVFADVGVALLAVANCLRIKTPIKLLTNKKTK